MAPLACVGTTGFMIELGAVTEPGINPAPAVAGFPIIVAVVLPVAGVTPFSWAVCMLTNGGTILGGG